MGVYCYYCGKEFNNKELKNTHKKYCEILDHHRGKTYTIRSIKEGKIADVIHVSNDAAVMVLGKMKHIYENPEELVIAGGFRVCSTGAYVDFGLFSLLALERLVNGENKHYIATRSIDNDIEWMKERVIESLMDRLEK